MVQINKKIVHKQNMNLKKSNVVLISISIKLFFELVNYQINNLYTCLILIYLSLKGILQRLVK